MYYLVYSPLVATSFLPEFPGDPGDLWGDLGQKPLQTTVFYLLHSSKYKPWEVGIQRFQSHVAHGSEVYLLFP